MNNLARNFPKINRSGILMSILLFGVALRVFQFLYNRSLWMDEIYLCSSFVYMDYIDFATSTLDYGQKAPIGFLYLIKLCVNLFGYHETALRLIPLLAGISSLLIFSKICKHLLSPDGQILALSIFSFAPALIYHSVEIKQYSTECLATVIALNLFILYERRTDWKSNVLWSVSGGVLIWFSFSVIFVLAGIAVGISLIHLLKKDWNAFIFNAIPFSLWLVSFGVNYAFITHKQESDWVVYFFKVYDNFMPILPHSLQELKWFPRNFMAMMDYPLGLNWNFNNNNVQIASMLLTIVPAILLFMGIFSVYKNRKTYFAVFTFPILLTLLASGLYLYPLLERFWVFLAPIFILLVALGFEYYRLNIRKYQYILMLLISCSAFFQALYFTLRPQVFYKHKKSFEREALNYISNHFRAGDAVYNYWNNAPGYKVYKNICNFSFTAIEGRDFRKLSADINHYNQNLKLDFKRFSEKKRVWLIVNNQFLTDIGDKIDDPKWYYKGLTSPTENIYMEFKKFGTPVKKVAYKDVTIYLFDLR